MNIFRLTGDLSHLAAIVILLLKIWKTRSCAGISGKSQLLFALVFTTRYLDLFTSFISLYNTSMKLIYIACSYATVYLIYMKFKATYDGNHDTFRVEFLVVPVGGLSFLVNHDFSPLEYSRERSSVCPRKCQRPSPASVLQGARTEFLPQQRHKMLDTENQKLNSFVADSHQWLCKNPEEKNQKVSVKCILPYLFLLLCTKIFLHKET
ncbi:ER lumen protein-retaining receptor 2 isoform X2 [Vulpes vulpes]|nr:ER lumen protein-retaining receptor 2 isoform X2 [Canis lupus dingo]XP_025841988.1 ER lumen protein-retaining receptor 2 isoform X2 [Vulpes vulpes]XP_038395418.1 ER lumen protein-retaining receptor 2 isoform X2 [Canis lupus familiaris]XP_038524206.1 ER lumen protein-retaining receptor 2 isoform X2 [Canis lupus familiaris]XP_041605887.1 ER lumen protein-retaining receptor 2 isoform X2 [Vulpes lagopus]XP_861402.1 ER lumen protein-retaining receptor 2 isoform X2 [Canis lupus familiaris]|eukprot:XP_861402.1 ER lumen protein-retaining receptor 2 isoform X2 [Canis lupus familiaris]